MRPAEPLPAGEAGPPAHAARPHRPWPRLRRAWRRLRRAGGGERGAAGLEFAAVTPAIMMLVLFTTDLVQHLRGQMRLEAVAAQVGQIVSRCAEITVPGDSSQLQAFAQEIAGGLTTLTRADSGGALVISAVYNDNGANRVAWQIRSGNVATASGIGGAGALGRLPADMVVPPGQTMLATEAFAVVSPFSLAARLMGSGGPREIYAVSLFLTRAPDAVRLQQAPTASNAMVCTA
jgi:hypothetical protein